MGRVDLACNANRGHGRTPLSWADYHLVTRGNSIQKATATNRTVSGRSHADCDEQGGRRTEREWISRVDLVGERGRRSKRGRPRGRRFPTCVLLAHASWFSTGSVRAGKKPAPTGVSRCAGFTRRPRSRRFPTCASRARVMVFHP
jgi:hypothetical protein